MLDDLLRIYILKGVGVPEYYLGGNVQKVKSADSKIDLAPGGCTSALSAHTYIERLGSRIARLLGLEDANKLRHYNSPMEADYHPEVDDTPLLTGEDISKYRMLIGSAMWAVTLGRYDVMYAVTTLARYNMAPREGHFKAALRIISYLHYYKKARLVFDTTELDIGDIEFVDHDWKELYPDAEEELPYDMPTPKMKPVKITAYFDADHASDLQTRRSVTGALIFVNSTPIKWYCKRQNTVESSTYGSELVAARLTAEMMIEMRYKLRMLGVPVVGPSMMLGDNMSVIQNCSLPSSTLKKKHNAIAYHRVREATAAGVIRLAHVRSENNYSDILTKALGGMKHYGLCKPLMFNPVIESKARREGSVNEAPKASTPGPNLGSKDGQGRAHR